MPQIKVFLNPKALNVIPSESFNELGTRLSLVLEATFGIQGKDDVAFDVFGVLYTMNEAPVQIEVLYTAGEDEYGTGKVFDPSQKEQDSAITNILAAFAEFLKAKSIDSVVPSVWIRPQHKSRFKPGIVG